jgi:membrane-bound serine protease (ClpP class)
VPKQSGGMPVSTTTVPENETLRVNVGHTGVVVSTLRPTGKARFGEVMVDVVAEAEFLDKGTKVQIIEMHGNRVVVKKFED